MLENKSRKLWSLVAVLVGLVSIVLAGFLWGQQPIKPFGLLLFAVVNVLFGGIEYAKQCHYARMDRASQELEADIANYKSLYAK